MKTALISVSDKTGIVEFAQALEQLDFKIISTGGTFKKLSEAGIKNLQEVADFTGFPEGLEGRIKTLTPEVFGGILNLRNNAAHQAFCQENNIQDIDLVVVNLYPFKKNYEDASKSFEDKVEQIDIGGPSMIRAAAKNYEFCAPVVDPEDYTRIIEELKSGNLSLDFRKTLAAKTFEMTAHYDLLIAKFWVENSEKNTLRYGENPHQSAVILNDPFAAGSNLVQAEILNGKALSYNNLNDANGALELAMSFDQPFVAIIKHASPCCAAIGENIEQAFDRAFESGDSQSAFGGIIAVNRTVTKALAEKIMSFFNEIVLAPDFDEDALEVLKTKKNLRVLKINNFDQATLDVATRKIRGGTLVQDLDLKQVEKTDLKHVTKNQPSEDQVTDMLLAWKIVKAVKSNAIVIVKDGALIGHGGGQTSRVRAMDIAIREAGERAAGAVLASDAFFPFPDAIEIAGEAKIACVIQPGGSIKDEDVFAKADELNIAMSLTGTRAFLH